MREEMRTFGYLCPECGRTVMGSRSVFALAASNAEVECECGKSALKVTYDGQRYHAFVPCGICKDTHEAIVPEDRMLRGGTALGCAKTKQFCCFIGPEGTVEKNLRELAIVVEKEGLDVAYGAIGIGEITSIPTAPAIADAYFRLNGEREYHLPLVNTPYAKK